MLRDIAGDEDTQVHASVAIMAAADTDILLLLDIDHDAGGAALTALADRLALAGLNYPHRLALSPNTGRPTGVDIDGDGRAYRARDAHGFGFFSGQGGMALLSRHPILSVRDFSDVLWADLPNSQAPDVTPEAALPILRLHSVAAWDVQVQLPDGPFHVLASHATPPVFDGPEDRNGRRNADETRFWQLYLDGWAPNDLPFASNRFALMATLNVDPARGEGRREALRTLLSHPALQDPVPSGPAGGIATTDWEEPSPGRLRVDYILPVRDAEVVDAGLLWPQDAPLMGITAEMTAEASDHRLIWMDLRF